MVLPTWPERNLGKTNPLNENDLLDFINLSKTQKLSDKSWFKNFKDINKETFNLDVKNPNKVEIIDNRSPEEIMTAIEDLDKDSLNALNKIKELLWHGKPQL